MEVENMKLVYVFSYRIMKAFASKKNWGKRKCCQICLAIKSILRVHEIEIDWGP